MILNYLRKNKFCIFACKILHWDSIKKFLKIRILKHRGFVFHIPSKGVCFFLPYYDTDHIQKHIFNNSCYYDQELLDFISKKWNNGIISKQLKNATILDIGANIGNHSLYFFNNCNIKESYNFEPIKDTFEILKRNIELNKLKANLYNVAVGKNSGLASTIHYDKGNIGATQLEVDEQGNIPIVSIDELSINSKITLVKIDVEGFENQVIKGMVQLIKRDKPFILIEIWNRNFDEIDNLLANNGYQKHVLNFDNTLGNYLYFST